MDIVEFWKLGAKILKKDEKLSERGESQRGKSTIRDLALKTGLNDDMLYKARVFAKQFELVEVRAMQKSGLSRSHASALTAVQQKSTRRKLARQAVDKGWSVRELRFRIRKASGLREYGGRSIVKLPTDVALEGIRMETQKVGRYADDLLSRDDGEIPKDLQRDLVKLRKQIRSLQAKLKRESS